MRKALQYTVIAAGIWIGVIAVTIHALSHQDWPAI